MKPCINGFFIGQDVLLPVYVPPEVSNDLRIVSPQTIPPRSKPVFIVEMDSRRDFWIIYNAAQQFVQLSLNVWESENHIVQLILVHCDICKKKGYRRGIQNRCEFF